MPQFKNKSKYQPNLNKIPKEKKDLTIEYKKEYPVNLTHKIEKVVITNHQESKKTILKKADMEMLEPWMMNLKKLKKVNNQRSKKKKDQ